MRKTILPCILIFMLLGGAFCASALPTAPHGFEGNRDIAYSNTNGLVTRTFTNVLNWTRNISAVLDPDENVVIVGQVGSYPFNQWSGTEIYNGTASTYSHTGLTVNQDWYYRAYSFNTTGVQWSNTNVTLIVDVTEQVKMSESGDIDLGVLVLFGLITILVILFNVVFIYDVLIKKKKKLDMNTLMTIAIMIIFTGVFIALMHSFI